MATVDEKRKDSVPSPVTPEFGSDHSPDNPATLQRRLNNRQVQLIAIGGAVGTGIFISIGNGLAYGGPGSLLLSFIFLSTILGLVNNSLAEMTVLMPVSGGFVRFASSWVDEALGFTAGWNFFLYEALLIPFEVTALNIVLSFWNEDLKNPGPTAAICAGVIILYALLNVIAVRAFGEAEFWLSGGKVVLIFMLLSFTFVTMVGGNPQHDAYGFRNWSHPGAFAEYRSTGALGKFEGFLACLWNTSFMVVGPEYICMVAAEAQRPRSSIKTAFKTLYYRLGIFFVGSGLAVGIIVAYNDPTLHGVIDSGHGAGTAAASPYVIAMKNMGIGVLPHIVNALMLTSIFSAGNTYTYCATRGLYGLALNGHAPRLLTKCTAGGVPVYAFCVVMIFPMLSFLQVSGGSQVVLQWLLSLITAGGLITYMIINITYLYFYRACKAQGLDRKTLPYCGRFQPWSSIIALAVELVIVIFYGYASFGPWSVESFFKNYSMQIVAPCLFIFWKLFKKTKTVDPKKADLIMERPEIDAHEASFSEPPISFWAEVGEMVGIKRRSKSKSSTMEDGSTSSSS
jgi:amino acid transporter